jgi:antitoxin (DNA-binding transcriptional repressor) of toxin-antitoxin stability system
MLFEIDVEEGPARFAELIETIDAGYGVLIRRGGEVIARLAPESAFAPPPDDDPDAHLTPEERQAKEVLEMFESSINDSF